MANRQNSINFAATTNTQFAVGLTEPGPNALDVSGAAALGTYGGATSAPSNGLIVSGSVGIGTESPQNKTDIAGAAVIGSGIAGSTVAPTNGLTVEGSVRANTSVSIATSTISETLRVNGNVAFYNSTVPYFSASQSSNNPSVVMGSTSASTVTFAFSSAASSSQSINFRDNTATQGSISYSHTNNRLDFTVEQVRTARVTGTGWGIGGVAPSATLNVSRASVATSGVVPYFQVDQVADTGQTASTEGPTVLFNFDAATRTWATGALTTQRFFRIDQPTIAFAGASTVTDAATMGIVGGVVEGSNATVTNSHALLISAGAVSTATNSYGLSVNAQTGATNNYAAQFIGGNVGIGTAAPAFRLHVSDSDSNVVLIDDDGTDSPVTSGTNLRVANNGSSNSFALAEFSSGSGNIVLTNAVRVGIGVIAPQNPLDVEGAVAIGASYSGTNTAPSNGMIVEGNVGIATNSPGGTLEVAGSLVFNYTGITNTESPYTVTSTDYYIGADTTSGAITVQLPNGPSTGRIFVVKDVAGTSGTNNITVTTVGGVVTIDGATSQTISANFNSLNFIFNGTSYEIY